MQGCICIRFSLPFASRLLIKSYQIELKSKKKTINRFGLYGVARRMHFIKFIPCGIFTNNFRVPFDVTS